MVDNKDNPDSILGPQESIRGINAKGDEPCDRENDLIKHGDKKGRLWTRQAIDQLIVGHMYGNNWCWTTIAIYLTWEHQDLSTLIEEELAPLFSFVKRFKRYRHWHSKTYVDEDVQRVLNGIYAVLLDERWHHDSDGISDWRRQRPVLGLSRSPSKRAMQNTPRWKIQKTRASRSKFHPKRR
ncbi:hypothetical protein MMC07_000065 [Pseudocyphellaria aurata]|nr:hypothetical protein [Pseudocyphellaria aurata]